MAEKPVLKLSESVDISISEQLHEQLEALLQAGGDVVIDAQAVERIDTTVFQLLFSFQQTLAKQHSKSLIVSPSPSFMANATLLGLHNELNIQL